MHLHVLLHLLLLVSELPESINNQTWGGRTQIRQDTSQDLVYIYPAPLALLFFYGFPDLTTLPKQNKTRQLLSTSYGADTSKECMA